MSMDKSRFVIVGAGDIIESDLSDIGKTDCICAADAGYLSLKKLGVEPDIIIGDFDSMAAPDTQCEIITLPVEKDDTDSAYCIKEGLRRGYDSFLLLGMLGGSRISHTIANIQLLSFIRKNGAWGEILSGSVSLKLLLAGESVQFASEDEGEISVFALSDTAEITENGLYYQLSHGILERSFPLGVSNCLQHKKPAQITVHAGEILLIRESL